MSFDPNQGDNYKKIAEAVNKLPTSRGKAPTSDEKTKGYSFTLKPSTKASFEELRKRKNELDGTNFSSSAFLEWLINQQLKNELK